MLVFYRYLLYFSNNGVIIYSYTSINYYLKIYIIAKTICTNFQNEMCIFPHFFAVRLPAWNII